MLNADELGEKGQARFKEICADAGLICNKSDRDRTGWDFIVEFQYDVEAATELETRKVPLSCHVQVKTLLDKNDRFQMRLSSAERLAKELKPAFVYVFKVNSSLEFTAAYLIHILDQPLGKILKRLRKEDVAGNSAANRKTLSMSASGEGLPISPTGLGLRKALSTAIGNDLNAYSVAKEGQLMSLGFEERPYSTEMNIQMSMPDLVDAFLGLKEISATGLRAEHTRFGIPRQLPEITTKNANVRIQPSPADMCTITIRGDSLSAPAVFKCKAFFPAIPELPAKYRKILFVNDLFTISLTQNGMAIKSNDDLPPQTPSDWASYWLLAFIMATGKGTMRITSEKLPIDTEGAFTTKMLELDPQQCMFLSKLSECVAFLLKFSGIIDEPKVSMKAIVENASGIFAAYSFVPSNSKPPLISLTTTIGEVPDTSKLEAIYADFIEIGTVKLAYYGMVMFSGAPSQEDVKWQSEDVYLKKIVLLRSVPEDYELLIENAKRETGCDNVFRGDLNRPIVKFETL
jgi:hypothetical protein